MKTPNGDFAKLQERTDRNRIDFLRTELDLCTTLVGLAKTQYAAGDRERAGRLRGEAQRGYATLQHFLNDPKHSRHLTDAQMREFTDDATVLHERLDELTRTP